jgi:hypothetical protein
MKKEIHRPLTAFFWVKARINVTLYLRKENKYFLAQMILEKFQFENTQTHPFLTKLLMSADSLRSMALLDSGFYSTLSLFLREFLIHRSWKYDKVETFSCKTETEN